jgi:hypothetical protein
VQEAAILALNTHVGCRSCAMVHDLRLSSENCCENLQRNPNIDEKDLIFAGRLEVDATLCDQLADFHSFTKLEFGFEANTCNIRNTSNANISNRRGTVTSAMTPWFT